MNMRMTRDSYEEIITQDLEWLRRQPRSLESEHIAVVLEHSVNLEYPKREPFERPEAMSLDVVVSGCKNIGYDLNCGACAEVFFTGGGISDHGPDCKTHRCLRAPKAVVSIPERLPDPPVCARCGEEYLMTEPDQEPTRYCNECCHDALEEVLLSRQAANDRVAELERQLDAEIALTRERDEARAIATRLVKAMILWGAWEDGVPEPECYGKNNEDAATAFDDAVRLIPDWRKQGR